MILIASPHPSGVAPGVETAPGSWSGVHAGYKDAFCLSGMGPLLNMAPSLSLYMWPYLWLSPLRTKKDGRRGHKEKCTKGKHCPLRLTAELAHLSIFQAGGCLRLCSRSRGLSIWRPDFEHLWSHISYGTSTIALCPLPWPYCMTPLPRCAFLWPSALSYS